MENKYLKYLTLCLLLPAITFTGCSDGGKNRQETTRSKEIRVSLNESPFDIPQNVKDSILNELPKISRYAGEEGNAFLEFVAAHEGVEADQIIPGEILDLLGIYLAQKGGAGSEFIYTVPGYPALVNAAESVGGKIIPVPLNRHLENDLEAIESKVNDKTQAVFLINPHNPSGTVSEKKAFHDFISRISKKAVVIIDEAYLEYAGDFEGRTALSNLKAGENIIIFRTLAKAYGLGGLTIGYAIASKELAGYLRSKGLGDGHALNRLSIAAAKAALNDQTHLQEVYRVIAEEREKWHAFLDKQGWEHSASEANFVFFDTQRPAAEVKQELEERGIFVAKPYPPYHTWLRISIGLPEENETVRSVLREIIK